MKTSQHEIHSERGADLPMYVRCAMQRLTFLVTGPLRRKLDLELHVEIVEHPANGLGRV